MNLLNELSRVRVLCVGDVMVDRFVNGVANRISPESPVPVLSILETRAFPGGAANVARNISALGSTCTLMSVVGNDHAADELESLLQAIPQLRSMLIRNPGRPTTEKLRFVAQGQHLLRADYEATAPLCSDSAEELIDVVVKELPRHDVLVLSDYAKGVLTDDVISRLLSTARTFNIPSIVDPKSTNFARYSGATVITPNSKETKDASGIDPAEDENASLAGRMLHEMGDFDAILITRAHKGMTLVPRSSSPLHIPASTREVFDVAGAGDTVVATMALALGAKATPEEAAQLANVAAGIVVGKRGTATVSRTELADEQTRLGRGNLASIQSKIKTVPELLELIKRWRDDGHTIGLTNGCFDILHVGHLSLLSFARRQCGRLLVAINTDASVTRLKGPSRPVNSETDRATVLAALTPVDAVVMFDEDTPLSLIEQIVPDVLVKGADYSVEQIVGSDVVLSNGGRVLTAELVPGRSTSNVITEMVKIGSVQKIFSN